MRALVNTRAGGPEVLELTDGPDPRPGPSEVLVRVKRAGLNFSDLAGRVGLYPDAPPFPMVMGYELAGLVEATGAEVLGFQRGDRVLALTRFGAQATHVVVPENQLYKVPEQLSFDEAAALPVNYLTAYHLLFHVAPLKSGMTVLIHSAAGGVGLAALQLARTVPYVELFGTASTPKHPFLRERGLDHPLDSRSGDYVKRVRELTGGLGVHRVLDALGGPDWARGYSLLRSAGHLLCFGWANMIQGPRRNVLTVAREFLSLSRFSPMDLMAKNRSVSGVNMLNLMGELALLRSHMEALLELARQGIVKPYVGRVFPLARAREAHAWLQGREAVGKVLLDCE